MRKFCLIVAVILLAAPAWARVDVLCDVNATTKVVTVSYDANNVLPAKKVRAFALDITISKGVITDVNDNVNPWYDIYPGSISIVDGVVVDDGNAVADPCDYPADTKGGIGTSGITVEMGGLWMPPDDDNDPNAPPWQYRLLTFRVSDANACVVIAKNVIRGGVVLTDASSADVNAPGCCLPSDCFPAGYSTYVHYTDYKTNGWNPDCWCSDAATWPCVNHPCKFQCDGDADGATETGFKYRVYGNDLAILLANWKKKDAALPANCPRVE